MVSCPPYASQPRAFAKRLNQTNPGRFGCILATIHLKALSGATAKGPIPVSSCAQDNERDHIAPRDRIPKYAPPRGTVHHARNGECIKYCKNQ